MTQPGIPRDDPETRHDPSVIGAASILASLAVVAVVAFAQTGDLLLAGVATLGAGIALTWLAR